MCWDKLVCHIGLGYALLKLEIFNHFYVVML